MALSTGTVGVIVQYDTGMCTGKGTAKALAIVYGACAAASFVASSVASGVVEALLDFVGGAWDILVNVCEYF